MPRPPLRIGVKLLACFFAFGTLACAVTIVALLFPDGAMDALWRLNPEAKTGFAQLGRPLAVLLMAIVGTACGLASFGLSRGREWARRLAIAILAVNLLGDLLTAFVRHDRRALIGLPIGGAMIFYLTGLNPARMNRSRGT